MRKLVLTLLLGTLSIVSCTDNVLTTNNESPNLGVVESRGINNLTFEFPAIQWGKFETHEQKIAACEIPDSILSDIPTEELVEICMKYPLLLDAYAFNTPLQGIKTVASRFNGFKELMGREDNCIHILGYLKQSDITKKDFSKMTQIEAGRLTLVYALAEYVLSFDKVLSNATEGIANEIDAFVADVMNCKESQCSYHALGSLTSSVYLWASIQTKRSKSRSVNPIVDQFLETGLILNQEQYWEIKQQCQTVK